MTNQAEYTTLRFNSKKKPTVAEIAKAVEGTKSPAINPIQARLANSPKV